eukprot:TRINITY_DN3258_c1_g1_i1.p1 TRINITY_DN3258_c1_g1~~TRINITY_DN3258_c1_g1_i1.p1  ORF type:complete len:185 (-),score=-25.77 TRINITY_DN3258_c1_g1_i1:263-817(-)
MIILILQIQNQLYIQLINPIQTYSQMTPTTTQIEKTKTSQLTLQHFTLKIKFLIKQQLQKLYVEKKKRHNSDNHKNRPQKIIFYNKNNNNFVIKKLYTQNHSTIRTHVNIYHSYMKFPISTYRIKKHKKIIFSLCQHTIYIHACIFIKYMYKCTHTYMNVCYLQNYRVSCAQNICQHLFNKSVA